MSEQGKIVRMEEYRPHIVIPTDNAHHVYPMAYFESIVKGEAVEPIPEDVLRVIVKEWLASKESYG